MFSAPPYVDMASSRCSRNMNDVRKERDAPRQGSLHEKSKGDDDRE